MEVREISTCMCTRTRVLIKMHYNFKHEYIKRCLLLGPFNMSTGACDAGIGISNGTLIGTGGWLPSFGVTGNGRSTHE